MQGEYQPGAAARRVARLGLDTLCWALEQPAYFITVGLQLGPLGNQRLQLRHILMTCCRFLPFFSLKLWSPTPPPAISALPAGTAFLGE